MLALLLLTILQAEAITDLMRTSGYIQPHLAVGYAQQYHKAFLSVSHSDKLSIKNHLEEIFNPVNMLGKTPSRWVSDSCGNQSRYTLDELFGRSNNKLWAEQMIDSWAKPGSGILQGQIRWLGDYSECVSIGTVVPINVSFPVSPFKGKYCAAGLQLANNGGLINIAIGFVVGLCVPSGCSDADVSSMVKSAVDRINANISSQLVVDCLDPDQPLSHGAVTVIVVFALFAALCVLGTACDYWFHINQTSKEDDVPPISSSSESDLPDTEIMVPVANADDRTPGKLGCFLMCFSFYTNGSKMLSTRHTPDQISCVHGMRFISLSWVVLGHTLVFAFPAISNFLTVVNWKNRFTFQFLINGTFSVDTFFALSGLLSCYLFLKQYESNKTTVGKFFAGLPVAYLHRYIRLTPAYGALIAFYTFVIPYLYNGPLKSPRNVQDVNCLNNSWTNLIYLSNLIDTRHQCTVWGWYLSNDFQFYVITPFLAYLLYRSAWAGLVLSTAAVIVSCGSAVGVSIKYDLGLGMLGVRNASTPVPDQSVFDHMMDDFYVAPWCRYQSYGIGVLYGFVLWKLHGRKEVPRAANLVLWAVSFALLLLVTYGPYKVVSGGHIASVTEAAVYNGFARAAWAVGVGYIVLACALHSGGWVNKLLSWAAFLPLSRISYCAYLVHPAITTLIFNSQESLIYWKEWMLILSFPGFLTLSYATAAVFSLVFEAPFMLIDKYYLTGYLIKSEFFKKKI